MARVAFCQEMPVEYMGYMSMAAVLKRAGHTVEVFLDDDMNRRRLLAEIEAFKPDIVGFSVLTPSVPWALNLAAQVKERTGALTLFGNSHVIFCPEIIEEDSVDMVCIGEGEEALLDLCNALENDADHTHIAGLWVKTSAGIMRNPKRDMCISLDNLPSPDRSIYYKYKIFRTTPNLRVMNGRGCPFSCSFCGNRALREHLGPEGYVRKWSPQRSIEELELAIQNHPVKPRTLFFVDEVFWITRPWLHEFLALYKERIHLPFVAALQYVSVNEEDIRLIAEAGASAVYLAAETHDEQLRTGLLNKNLSNDRIFEIAGWLKKHRLDFGVSAFFGLPGETVESHLEGLEFYRRLDAVYLWTCFVQPYPGTRLAEEDCIKAVMPANKPFPLTTHHEPYLNIPDSERIARLKRVYFLCAKFPVLCSPLVWLTRFRIPVLFDFLFLLHFTYYTFRVEGITFYHFLIHLKGFLLKALARKT